MTSTISCATTRLRHSGSGSRPQCMRAPLLEAEEIRLRRRPATITTQEPTLGFEDLYFLTAHTHPCTLRHEETGVGDSARQLGSAVPPPRGRHDVWTDGQRQEAIPRHRDQRPNWRERFSNGFVGTNEYAIRWQHLQRWQVLAG